MTAAMADVSMTCLEIFYLLFLLGKEKGKSRMAKAFLFASLAAVHAGMRYLGAPVFLKMVVPIVLVVMVGAFAYEASRIKLGFFAVVSLILSYASETDVKLIWGFFDQPVLSGRMVSKGVPVSLMIVAKALQFFLLYLIRAGIYYRTDHISRYEIFPVILSGLSFIMVLIAINTNMAYIPGDENQIVLLAGDVGILAAFILSILFTEKYIEVKRISEEEKQKSMQLELQYQYYVRKKEDMDSVRQIYHDLENHVRVLEQPERYSRISHGIQAIEDYYKTGNGFLDVIIADKMRKASKKQIRLECKIDFSQGSFVHPFDISTIFGNLLDNAVEALEKTEAEEKYIVCKAGRKRDFLIIMVLNPYDRTKEGHLKRKAYMHGFGLKNVQDSVKKYEGNYSVEKESGTFKVNILLPVPNSV